MDQRVLLAAVLAVCICMGLVGKRPAWAQSGPAAQRVDQIIKQLKVTPQQRIALLPVLTAEAPDMEAIRSDPSLSGVQKLEQFNALFSRTDPQVKCILNPRQYQKLQQIRNREIQERSGRNITSKVLRIWGGLLSCAPIADRRRHRVSNPSGMKWG